MRKREDISRDGTRPDFLILEVLLDIRELLSQKPTVGISKPIQRKNPPKKRGRPKKAKSDGRGLSDI